MLDSWIWSPSLDISWRGAYRLLSLFEQRMTLIYSSQMHSESRDRSEDLWYWSTNRCNQCPESSLRPLVEWWALRNRSGHEWSLASRTVLTEALFLHLILICCKQTIVSIGLFDANSLNFWVNPIEFTSFFIFFSISFFLPTSNGGHFARLRRKELWYFLDQLLWGADDLGLERCAF